MLEYGKLEVPILFVLWGAVEANLSYITDLGQQTVKERKLV
jgi:hypothetical protein